MSSSHVLTTRSTTTRWLPALRACWLLLTGVLAVLWLIGEPTLFRLLLTPCAGASCQFIGFTPEQFLVLRAAGITPHEYAVLGLIVFNLAVLVWLGMGMLIFFRRGDSLGMLVISFAIATNPLTVSAPPLSVIMFGPVLMLLVGVFQLVGDVLFYAIFFIFPDGRFVPRWTRWIFFAGIINAFLQVALPPSAPINDPSSIAGVLSGVATGCVYLVAFGAQVYRYRRVSTPRQRQQSKWAVLGLLAAGVGQAILVVASQYVVLVHATDQAQAVAYLAANTFTPLVQLLIPLSIGAAILRSGLWDIDVIIRRTVIYGTLTAILAAVYFAVVIIAQTLGDRLTGQQSPPAWLIVVTTLLIAALFTPLRRRIQTIIDRRFYRSKYNAARTLEAFAATLRTETDLDELSTHVVAVIQETMQPAHVSLWLRPAERTGPPRSGIPDAVER